MTRSRRFIRFSPKKRTSKSLGFSWYFLDFTGFGTFRDIPKSGISPCRRDVTRCITCMQHVYIHRVYTPCIYTVRAHTCKHRDEEVTPSEMGSRMVHFGVSIWSGRSNLGSGVLKWSTLGPCLGPSFHSVAAVSMYKHRDTDNAPEWASTISHGVYGMSEVFLDLQKGVRNWSETPDLGSRIVRLDLRSWDWTSRFWISDLEMDYLSQTWDPRVRNSSNITNVPLIPCGITGTSDVMI